MDLDLGQEIATLSENIWLSVLGLALHPSATPDAALPGGPTVDGSSRSRATGRAR